MARGLRTAPWLLALPLVLGGFGPASAPAAAGEDTAWLGVQLQRLDPDLGEALNLEGGQGVLIAEVMADSPAEAAGLEEGDVILRIGDSVAKSVQTVVRTIRGSDPGDVIDVEINRDGEIRTFQVTLGEREEDDEVVVIRRPGKHLERLRRNLPLPHVPGLIELEKSLGGPRLGVETRRLDADLAWYFGVDEGEGALVMNVIEDTPAEEAGLKAGDVILALNDSEIHSPGDLRDLVVEKEGETVSLKVRRQKRDMTVQVTLEPSERVWHTRKFELFEDDEETESLRDELDALRGELDRLREEIRSLKD